MPTSDVILEGVRRIEDFSVVQQGLERLTGVLSIAAQRGFSPKFISEIDHLRLGEGFSGLVAQSGEPMVVRNVSEEPARSRV